MPQFSPRRSQPPRPDTYRRLARLLRQYADRIESLSDPQSPQERRVLTMALTALSRLTRDTWRRHCGLPVLRDAERLLVEERAAHELTAERCTYLEGRLHGR